MPSSRADDPTESGWVSNPSARLVTTPTSFED